VFNEFGCAMSHRHTKAKERRDRGETKDTMKDWDKRKLRRWN
jgi:hypothetical protein